LSQYPRKPLALGPCKTAETTSQGGKREKQSSLNDRQLPVPRVKPERGAEKCPKNVNLLWRNQRGTHAANTRDQQHKPTQLPTSSCQLPTATPSSQGPISPSSVLPN